MNYAAQIDENEDVQRVIVIPDGETEEYCATLGLTGTWRHAPTLCGIGMRFHEGGFYPHWYQVEGAGAGDDDEPSGFQAGREVWHNGAVWVSTVDYNVSEPGVALWHRKDGTWIAPTGAGDAYALGAEVTHSGQMWRSTVDANVWEPGVFGWDVLTP